MRSLPLLAALVLVTSLFAGAAAAEDTHKRPRVLVLDVKSTEMSPSEIETLSNLATNHLGQYQQIEVISGQDMKRLMAVEAQRQMMGCEESSCLAEIADALGADLVVFGQAGKLGTGPLMLTLSLFDREKSTAVGRVAIEVDKLENLSGYLPAALDQLFTPVLGARRATPSTAPGVVLGSHGRAAFDAEAMQLCMDTAEAGKWSFCDARNRVTENDFVRAYQKKTGLTDLDRALVDRVPDAHYVSLSLFGIGGALVVGGVGLGAANIATKGAFDKSFPPNATVNGFAAAAGGVVVAAAGAVVFLFVEPRFDDGEATDHTLTEPEGRDATKRFNDALAKEVKAKYAD